MESSKFDMLAHRKIEKMTAADVMSLMDSFKDHWRDKPDYEIVEIGSPVVMFGPNVSSFGETEPTRSEDNFVLRWHQPYSKIKYFEIKKDIRVVDYARMDLEVFVNSNKILGLNIESDEPYGKLDLETRFKVRRIEVIHRTDVGIVVRCWKNKQKSSV